MLLSNEQQHNIENVRNWLEANIPALWNFEERVIDGRLERRISVQRGDQERCQATLEQLEQAVGAEAMVDFYCYPAEQGLPWRYHKDHTQAYYIRLIAYECLKHYVNSHHSSYAERLLLARLRQILLHPLEREENEEQAAQGWRDSNSVYLPPEAREITDALNYELDFSAHEAEFGALLRGEWSTDVAFYSDYPKENSCNHFAFEIRNLVFRAICYFAEQDRFGYDEYAALLDFAPHFLDSRLLEAKPEYKLDEQEQRERRLFKAHARRYVWQQIQDLEPMLERSHIFTDAHPMGGRWLLKACEEIESRGYTSKIVNKDSYEYSSALILFMLQISALEEGENLENLAQQLKAYSKKTLWLVLPFAAVAQKAVLMALDEEKLLPLHEYTYRIASGNPYSTELYTHDFCNCEDPKCGVLNQEELGAVLKGVPEKSAITYCKAMRASKVGFNNTTKLIESYLGVNRTALEKSVAKHHQAAIKAYGLLPIESEEDTLTRYTTLKQVWKGSSKYGAERQANTRAAVSAGLANLAQRAGYRDAARMEWELEAAIGQQSEALGQEQVIGEWSVAIAFEGIKPVLKVSKQDKVLKTVPAGLRKHPEYAPLKESMATLKEQASRFRRTLEQMMSDGESIAAEDLKKLSFIPAVNFLLGNLLGVNEQNQIGLIDASNLRLLDGEQCHPVSESLRIAHVYDLFQNNLLSQWQQRIVQEQRVQPFKQAFRELYVITPAEEQTAGYSNRFAGHTINTSIAYRLLQSRGWNFISSDVAEVYKYFPAEKISVNWEFPEARHFFSEESELNADKIEFIRGRERISLTEVPPLVFSETMRDADLVVSVANINEDSDYWSTEAKQNRVAVARNIIESLGMQDVTFDGNFAFIKGTLANYRIHMGSGNIHINEGNYLCIVPDPGKKKSTPIYLPFADTDAKTSEIVSKILLLKNDSRIKDETILAQIHAGSDTQ